jgi:ribonuclease T2
MKARALAAAALLACLCEASAADDRAGDFDFYILALSWSPTWCRLGGGEQESLQCRDDAGFGFVVHGLWPQYEHGSPERCGAAAHERIPSRIAEDMSDLMPDRDLVFGQWRKHGSCSGLSPEEYFELTREAFDRITIPDGFRGAVEAQHMSARDVETAFVEANPGLSRDGLSVECEAGQLEEVRICLTRDLEFRHCGEAGRHGCRQTRLEVPAPR